MSVQSTARDIVRQWAREHSEAPELADKLIAALRSEFLAEAADEVAAIPLPSTLMAHGGPMAMAVRRSLNDASRKLQQLADQSVPKCPPGTHLAFVPCPGTCFLPKQLDA